MNPTVNGSTQFSDCSLQQIQRVVTSATCLSTVAPNDVSIRLGTLPSQLLAGQSVSGTIFVENTGPSDTFGVLVTATSTGIRLSSNACGNATSSIMACNIDRLGSGTTTAILFDGNNAPPGRATITIQATSANDPDPTNNTASAAIDFAPAADLHLSDPVASPTAVHPGEESVLKLDLTNNGPSAATNVLASVSATPSYELVGVSAAAGTCAANVPQDGSWTCSLGTLALNQSQSLSVRVRASAASVAPGAVLFGSVTVQARATEPLLSSGVRTYDGPVTIAAAIDDLAVEIDPPAAVAPGAQTEVIIVARNDGPDASDQVQLRLDFNAMSVDDALTDVGGCVPNNGLVICILKTLGAGQRVTVKAHATAGSSAGSVDVQATVGGPTPDLNSANNVAHRTLTVSAPAPPTPPPAPSGGGGGAADPFGLVALLAILIARRAGRRSVVEAFTVSRVPHIA